MSENTTLVRVTSEHIKRGTPRRLTSCPVALAVMDAIGKAGTHASVDGIEIVAWVPGEVWTASPSRAVDDFIYFFDNGEPVDPFEFTVTWRVETNPLDLS